MSPFTSSATASDTVPGNDITTDSAAVCLTYSDNDGAVEVSLKAADIGSSPNAQIRPSAQSTATGFLSPLTIMKNYQRSSNQPICAIDRYSTITAPLIDAAHSIKIGQAREKTKRSFDRSKLLKNDEFVFPRLEMHELTLGKVLGQGGFGTVLEIKAMDVIPPPQDDMDKKFERIVFDINEVEEERKRRNSDTTNNHSMFHEGWLRGDAHFAKLRKSDTTNNQSMFHEGWLRGDAKSHGCLQGEIVDLLDSATDVLTAGVKGGIQLGRYALRKNHKHHGGMMVHPEQGKHETEQPLYELQKSAIYEESRMRNADGFMGEPSQKVSRIFSFLSWRDSMAGEEGNDAESPKKIMNGSTEECSELAKQEGCYVIKLISQSIVENDFQKFLQAAKDLATETYFLSVLNHPNILKLRAVGQG
jgi:hypothetical protein